MTVTEMVDLMAGSTGLEPRDLWIDSSCRRSHAPPAVSRSHCLIAARTTSRHVVAGSVPSRHVGDSNRAQCDRPAGSVLLVPQLLGPFCLSFASRDEVSTSRRGSMDFSPSANTAASLG